MEGTDRKAEGPPADDPRRIRRYWRLGLGLSIAALAASAAYVAAMAAGGCRALAARVEPWAGAGLAGRGVVLAIFFAGFAIVGGPFEFAAGWWRERRYGVGREGPLAWLWRRAKAGAIALALAVCFFEGIYGLAEWIGGWWWLGAAAVAVAIEIALGYVFPTGILPLFYRMTRLEDPALEAEFARLAGRAGFDVEGVYRMELSGQTSKATAFLAGLGRTRRVIVSDTLLEDFTPGEIKGVFAHEIGHHAGRHVAIHLALGAAATTAALGAAALAVAALSGPLGFRGPADVANAPVIVGAAGAMMLAASPLLALASRATERAADRYALEATGDSSSFVTLMEKLARRNLSLKNPGRLAKALLFDHPPVAERIEMARRLEDRARQEDPGP